MPFRTFERLAFRLETREHYAVVEEADAYRAFLAGEPFDLWWHEPWLAGIRDITASGRQMRRVRLMTEPPTAYQRFELAVTPANERAGEDIRILLQRRAQDLFLPDYDFWIFDDEQLGIMHFDEDGVFHGIELTGDPTAVSAHRAARDRALSGAVTYAQYIAAHPLHA